jgi:serine/threonine protein kinase
MFRARVASQTFARFGPYTLLGTLAEGGMARVFLAQRDSDEDVCVLKQLHGELESHPTASRRLQREAVIASTLRHPNIARILESGSHEGTFYIAMEFIAGQTLADVLLAVTEQRATVPPDVAIGIVAAALDGLDYAHEVRFEDGAPLGLVHRDVTPRNIMIAYGGEVKIIDFGIARAEFADDFRTNPGVVLGTLAHMSPEQALALEVDRRSDLYSAGAILYQLLSDRPVVPMGTAAATLHRIVSESPPTLRELKPTIPHALSRVVAKAIAKQPEARHQSAREFRDALLDCWPDIPGREDIARFMHGLFSRQERETHWLVEAAHALQLDHREAFAETVEDRLERLLRRASSRPDPMMWTLEETDPAIDFGDDATMLIAGLSQHVEIVEAPVEGTEPRARDVAGEIRNLESEEILHFSLRELPLHEVLLTLHEIRFTGTLDIAGDSDTDRLFFRLGALVGISSNRELDAQIFQSVLLELRLIPPSALENVPLRLKHVDAPLLGSYLKERGLIAEEELERARAEQRLRRLFLLFDRPNARVRLLEGVRDLDNLIPTYTDVLPVIAYGIVVRSDSGRRKQLAKRVARNRVRLIAPYEQERNRYGLPPQILQAIRLLNDEGVDFDAEPALSNLDSWTTLGVLLLFDRISLLRIEPLDTDDLTRVPTDRGA